MSGLRLCSLLMKINMNLSFGRVFRSTQSSPQTHSFTLDKVLVIHAESKGCGSAVTTKCVCYLEDGFYANNLLKVKE